MKIREALSAVIKAIIFEIFSHKEARCDVHFSVC